MTAMNHIFNQSSYQFRFDWGQEALQYLAPESDVVVIIDVLSFTTAVSVAVERGATVYPYRWADDSAVSFAQTMDATLLGKRAKGSLSLSPSSLADVQPGQRLIMPSPNGSTLSSIAASLGKRVMAGSLRNAEAVAGAVRNSGCSVAVIAAGERWPGGNLRPAVEDLVGAGAILSQVDETGLSPESKIAVAAFRAVEHALQSTLMDCASGRELAARGFSDDIQIASRLNESEVVPMLINGAYSVQRLPRSRS